MLCRRFVKSKSPEENCTTFGFDHPDKPNEEKNTPPPVAESVELLRIQMDFRKSWLENQAEVETHIASHKTKLPKLEADLREQVKNVKRIKL